MCVRNFASPHMHPQSFDSGSTCAKMVNRAVELGTGIVSCTDHGSMNACRKMYDLATKAGIKAALGIEFYFRDDDCPILGAAGIPKSEDGTYKSYMKYAHGTMHALDQTAYEAMARVLSRTYLNRAERHGTEVKPIFCWQDLEELGSYNTTIGTGCLVGMVSKHLIGETARVDIATQYYERLRSIFKPGNLIVEVFPHRCDRNWEKAVYLTCSGEIKEQRLWYGKNLRVTINGEQCDLAAFELADKFAKWNGKKTPNVQLIATKYYNTWKMVEAPTTVTWARVFEGFVDNECSPFAPDGAVQIACNKFVVELANKYGDPVQVSDDSHFAVPEEKDVQDLRLLSGENNKTKSSAPAFRFAASYHMMSGDEAFASLRDSMGITAKEWDEWVDNSYAWRDRFGWKWQTEKQLPTKFYPTDTLQHLMSLIQQQGRMDWSNPEWVQRLKSEIKMLYGNGTIDLLPYFSLAKEAVEYYESQGHLSGVGRGSAGGLGLAYLLGITHIDPIRYGLSKERFLTPSRIQSGKLPDIDMDFSQRYRDVLVDPKEGWLNKRFGDHQARISTETSLHLRSCIQDAHRMLDGQVKPEVWQTTEKLPKPPQGISDYDFLHGYADADGNPVEGILTTDPTLQAYVAKYPKHWSIVEKALGVVKGAGKHASGWVVANRPISEFIPMLPVTDTLCTGYGKDDVEAVGGIKMDFLGISTLDDIESCLKAIQRSSGWVPEDVVVDGKRVSKVRVVPHCLPSGEVVYYDIWDLPEDQAVFDDIASGRTNKSIFQFGTPAAREWLKEFLLPDGTSTLRSIEDLSAFTALDRPGGLDAYVTAPDGERRNMLQEFAARAAGRQPCRERLPELEELFPETHGVVVYQEMVQKAFQILGDTTPEEADEFRVHTSKKQLAKIAKDRETFMAGATPKFGAEKAAQIFEKLGAFARYGFNKSHSAAYSIIGYACAWLQHYYPLEWWSAVLTNADRNEINDVFWRHVSHLILPPDIKMSHDEFVIEGDKIRSPLRLIVGLGPAAHTEIMAGRPYTDLRDFLTKIKNKKAVGANGKKGRSAISGPLLLKLVVSGCADSLFPAECVSVYDKLSYMAQVDAEVNDRRYKRTGELKINKVDERFATITPIQRAVLVKSLLPGKPLSLTPMIAQLGLPNYAVRGKIHTWTTQTKFQDETSVLVVPGSFASKLLAGEIEGIPPKWRFGVAAYVSSAKNIWKGQAKKIEFEVDGLRFELPMWPRKRTVDGKKINIPIELEPGLVGGVALLGISRWDLDKKFSIDEVKVVEQAFALKDAVDDEQSA